MFCWSCILVWSSLITNLTHNFSSTFISIIYMFRAAMCPSSGELLYQCDTWFMSLCVDDCLVCRSTCSCIPGSHLFDAQFFVYVYFYSLHVSGIHVPIIRRIIVSMRHLVYVTLCRWLPGMHIRRLFKRTISWYFVSQRRIKLGYFRVQIGSVSARFTLLVASILRESAVDVEAPVDVLSQNTVLLKLNAETT